MKGWWLILWIAALSVAPPAGAASADATVRLLALSDAFDPTLLDTFTRETGLSVLVDGVASAGDIEGALRQPVVKHDIVLLPADSIGARLRPDMLLPLAATSEVSAIDPRLMAALPPAAVGRAVPFDWYPLGFVVDAAKLKDAALPGDPAAGWPLLAKPDLLRQAEACGLGVPDRPQDLFALALAALPGARGANPLDRRRAFATLTRLRLQARKGTDAELADGLVQGEFCAVLLPAPTAYLAIDRAKSVDAGASHAFVLPAGGGVLSMDVLAIPAAAPNPDGALRLLRYLLRPDVAAANAHHGHVAPAVGAAVAGSDAFTQAGALDLLVLPGSGDTALERAIEAEWRRGASR